MRVLHVITGLGTGGAEHQLRLLLRRLPHECEVATLTNAGMVADAIRADGRPVHDLRMEGNRDLRVLPRLTRLIHAGRFGLVHTHLYRAGVYGRIAARLAGVRNIVATEHSIGDGIIEGRATTPEIRIVYRAAERLGTVTIAVSGVVADRLVAWGVPRRRIVVIQNGIELAAFEFDPVLRKSTRSALGIAENVPVVGAVGRLDRTKGFDLLIPAVAELRGTVLLLVGDGPARRELQALAASSGLGARLVFAGERSDVGALLSAMDVFASPSCQETFGAAVIEALASGLPTVYVTCPPLEELGPRAVPHAQRVQPEPDALLAALRRQLASVETGAVVRRPVPAVIGAFNIDRIAPAVSRLYHRVVEYHDERTLRGDPAWGGADWSGTGWSGAR